MIQGLLAALVLVVAAAIAGASGWVLRRRDDAHRHDGVRPGAAGGASERFGQERFSSRSTPRPAATTRQQLTTAVGIAVGLLAVAAIGGYTMSGGSLVGLIFR